MGAPRKIKETKVDHFEGEIKGAKAIVLAEYKGLTVHQLEDLRKTLRDAGGHLRVMKNTLAKVAFHNLGIEDMDIDLGGQVAFVFSDTDPVGGTKVANDFARKNDIFKIRSGWFEGQRLDVEGIKSLANLPSKHELQSRFVGTLAAPLSAFIMTLTAPISEFIATLDAKVAKMEASTEAEPVAEA